MHKEIMFSSKASKKSPYVFWLILLFIIMSFGVYICGVYLAQKTVPSKPAKISFLRSRRTCAIDHIPQEELLYFHFPQPKTYSREECECTPVRFFVILSMQRSGSGWFETLLNSHPNISSNGEIFSLKSRRQNMETIQRALDTVYNLEWVSSAAKNECVAAVGFKWMLNQGIMVYHRQITNYFKQKGVSVIYLFRRNLLRRLISLLANAYDKDAKLINGTHMSHVHTREQADLLAQFKPTINISSLIVDLITAERTMTESLEFFKSSRHMTLYYEDIIDNPKVLSDVQEFLRVPVRKLRSRQVKIHIKPLNEQVDNWDDVYRTVKGSQYEDFLQDSDYIS